MPGFCFLSLSCHTAINGNSTERLASLMKLFQLSLLRECLYFIFIFKRYFALVLNSRLPRWFFLFFQFPLKVVTPLLLGPTAGEASPCTHCCPAGALPSGSPRLPLISLQQAGHSTSACDFSSDLSFLRLPTLLQFRGWCLSPISAITFFQDIFCSICTLSLSLRPFRTLSIHMRGV